MTPIGSPEVCTSVDSCLGHDRGRAGAQAVLHEEGSEQEDACEETKHESKRRMMYMNEYAFARHVATHRLARGRRFSKPRSPKEKGGRSPRQQRPEAAGTAAVAGRRWAAVTISW